MLDELEGLQDSLLRLHAAVDAAPASWNQLAMPTGSPEGATVEQMEVFEAR